MRQGAGRGRRGRRRARRWGTLNSTGRFRLMFRLRDVLVVMLVVALCVLAYVRGRGDPLVLESKLARDGRGSLTIISPAHRIDRIYPSMHGPSSVHGNLYLAPHLNDQVLFVTGIDSQ